jgi:hypothetical protein
LHVLREILKIELGRLQAACAMIFFGIPDDQIAEQLGLNQPEMENLKSSVD